MNFETFSSELWFSPGVLQSPGLYQRGLRATTYMGWGGKCTKPLVSWCKVGLHFFFWVGPQIFPFLLECQFPGLSRTWALPAFPNLPPCLYPRGPEFLSLNISGTELLSSGCSVPYIPGCWATILIWWLFPQSRCHWLSGDPVQLLDLTPNDQPHLDGEVRVLVLSPSPSSVLLPHPHSSKI